ncbi:unnamed protein product [Pleuronectes platessa]|uniref:Uncharacterized protein n=1 Tax=Pleuronectes platessa TaxID=8262 RepID=A0A9N7U4H6_PLEPL|nr:unnamed protein product [Pleuronectes platessa]
MKRTRAEIMPDLQIQGLTLLLPEFKSTVPVPHRGMQLGLSPKSHYSNSSISLSPDSESSISNMSDREPGSSPDINMLECCLGEGSFVDNLDNNTLQQDDTCDTLLRGKAT